MKQDPLSASAWPPLSQRINVAFALKLVFSAPVLVYLAYTVSVAGHAYILAALVVDFAFSLCLWWASRRWAARAVAALDRANTAAADTHATLATIVTELEAARTRAEEASRLKSEFLGMVSHELRAPLHIIINSTVLLQEGVLGPLSPGQHATLDLTRKHSTRLLALINDLLDLTALEAGHFTCDPEPYDVRPLLHEVSVEARALLGTRPVKVAVDAPAQLHYAWADPLRVRQVVLNLAHNAAKFTQAGVITFSAGETEGFVWVAVADTGPGIPLEERAQLFQEFQQTRAGRRAGGTGLGLAISQRLVRVHGGVITLESAEGHGCVFRFTLPVVQE